jgi:hypothetical protein
VEVGEYAINKEIDGEPAFDWWVPYVLKRRDRIISAVNKRYHKRTHKYGIEIPKSIQHASELDRQNSNNLWKTALAKEMDAVRVAFSILSEGEPGYAPMNCHVIFDIKLDGFKRKARLVAGGHQLETPPVVTYSSVVS